MFNIDSFKDMEPMRYYDNPMPKTASAAAKRESIISGELSKNYIATRKFDGDWGMFIHYGKGNNLIRSRSISKVTGRYGDYTVKLPALVAEMDKWPDETVMLGELCLAADSKEGQTANTIGTILRCLPDKAIERQKTSPVEVHLFDMLMDAGEDLTELGYQRRLIRMCRFPVNKPFIYPIMYVDNFAEAADKVITRGGEGLVLQLADNPYMPGTRTAWKTLKLKQTLPHLELKVVDTIEPNKEYCGDAAETWNFKLDDGTLVTKPYYMGWKNGVVVDYNGVKVSVTSGLTDDDRAWLASAEAKQMIEKGDLFAEIKAMSENSRASLRHPCLVRLRYGEEI